MSKSIGEGHDILLGEAALETNPVTTGASKPWPWRGLVLAVVLGIWLGNARAQDSPTEAPATLSGVVVNSVTGEPIARALVASPDSRFATLTDSQGHFEFAIPPVQPASDPAQGLALIQPNRPTALVPRKPGYIADRFQDWQLDPSTKEVRLSLMPEARIVGHVELPSSEPAAALQVVLYSRILEGGQGRWAPASEASTRSTGEYRFADLSPGTYRLMTRELLDGDQLPARERAPQLYGSPPVFYPDAPDFSSAGDITLSAGQTFAAELKVNRQPYYAVNIGVVNPPPQAGFFVSVSKTGGHGPGFSLAYNEQTHAIEGLLPPGVYTLEAHSRGAAAAAGVLSFTVHDGPVSSRLTLASAPSVSFHVKEEFTNAESAAPTETANNRTDPPTRGPRRYLSLLLGPADDFVLDHGGTWRPSVTRDEDTFWYDGVTPGRYWVRFKPSIGYPASITSGGVDLQREPLVVLPGASTPSVEITMRDDGARVDGTVEGGNPAFTTGNLWAASLLGVNPAGALANYAHVYCIPLPDSSGRYAEAVAAPDGTFSLPNLPPGTYRVLAFKHRVDLEYRNSEAMQKYAAEGQVVKLSGGQVEHVSLALTTKDAQ